MYDSTDYAGPMILPSDDEDDYEMAAGYDVERMLAKTHEEYEMPDVGSGHLAVYDNGGDPSYELLPARPTGLPLNSRVQGRSSNVDSIGPAARSRKPDQGNTLRQPDQGNTLMHLAAKRGHDKIIDELLKDRGNSKAVSEDTLSACGHIRSFRPARTTCAMFHQGQPCNSKRFDTAR